jgi:hypothetical protein
MQIECRAFDRTIACEIDQTSTDKIGTVNPRGEASIVETTDTFKTNMNGVAITEDARNHSPTTITFNKKGLLVIGTNNGPTDLFRIGPVWQMMLVTPAPELAVKIGDTWKTDVPNRLVRGENTSVSSTLIAAERIHGLDTLRVHVRMNIRPGAAAEIQDAVNLDGYYNVDPLAGRLVRSEYVISNVPVRSPDSVGIIRVVVKREYQPIAQSTVIKSSS